MGVNAPMPGSLTYELDISLRRAFYGRYTIDIRFQDSDSDADSHFSDNMDPLDLAELDALRGSPSQYGSKLGNWLLQERVRAVFEKIQAVQQNAGAVLRVRLSLDDTAGELHRLHWETARYPESDRLMFVGENVLFSRYIRTSDFRRVQRRSRGDLTALLVIASPTDLAEQAMPGEKPLAQLNMDAERQLATEALGDIQIRTMEQADRAAPATLDRIMNVLRRENCDILYLVCHGARRQRQPHLWLEKDDRTSLPVPAEEFVTRLQELRNPPSLIVLASCGSAGFDGPAEDAPIGDGGVLAAVGPRLAAEGIPAVLAMQGNVTLGTVHKFMQTFFSELAGHGQLDRAASLARGAVRTRLDAWAPVLFTRLKGGAIWYHTGWDRDSAGNEAELMPTLDLAIRNGTCTPILGPGVLDNLLGSRREIARAMAEQFRFPLSPQDGDDLPQVAQYRSVDRGRMLLTEDYMRTICERILSRYRDLLPENLVVPLPRKASTLAIRDRCIEMLKFAWDHRVSKRRAEPYTTVSRLPFPVIISTNDDPLLLRAIEKAPAESGTMKAPYSEIFRWNPDLEERPSIFDGEKAPQFSADNPLLFQLFGSLEVPASVVLTQDDYFDALIAAGDHLPKKVKEALTSNTLLFLGFNVDDWHFRVLFRFIVNLPGFALQKREKLKHVAVQIDPEEQRFADPYAAKRYLAKYFIDKNIHIFWGSVDDFVQELSKYQEPVVVAAGGGA